MVIEEEAQLASESSELAPNVGELASDQDMEAVRRYLRYVETRRELAIAPLPSLLVPSSPVMRGLVYAPRKVWGGSSAIW